MSPTMTMSMSFSHLLVSALLRATELLPLILLTGWQVFLAAVLRPDGVAVQPHEGRMRIVRYDRRLTIGALTVTLVEFIVEFGHQSTMMSHRSLGELGPLIWPILTQTHFGNVMLAQAVLWGCVAMVWSLRVKAPPAAIASRRGLLLALVALWCLTQSLSGHAADQGSWTVDVLVDWFHLLAVSFWAGGLAALSILVPALMRRIEPAAARALLIRLLERFSPLAMGCVAVLIGAGLFSAHRRGVAFLTPLHSNYGQLVVIKIVLTGVAVGLGGFSRFIVLPALRRNGGTDATCAIGRFRRAIRVEASAVLLVILAAAVLTQTPPAGEVSLISGPMAPVSVDHDHTKHSSGDMPPMDDHSGEPPDTPSMD
jgi:putative copper export protein